MLTPLLLNLAVGLALAQPAPITPPLRQNGTAPLLYTRFLGPPGMQITFYRGSLHGTRLAAPSLVGLRPGYIYRMELSNLSGHPGISLYPTVEVIGTLRLPARISARKYPAPVVINEEDIEQAASGGMVTKLVYLEHPDVATPDLNPPDSPTETPVSAARDLIAEGHQVGRPVMIVRLGQRSFTPEAMARESTSGTILFPNETTLPSPGRPPVLAPVTWPWYDGFHGPRKPEEEYLYNGCINPQRDTRADRFGPIVRGGLPGINQEGTVGQLRPEDTVAEFTDSSGRRQMVVSNRVCLIVPRFAILRVDQPLNQTAGIAGPQSALCVKGQVLMQMRQPIVQAYNNEILRGLHSKMRASGVIGKDALVPLVSLKVLVEQPISVGVAEALCTKAFVQLNKLDQMRLQRQVEFALSLSRSERTGSFHGFTGPMVVGRVENGPEVVRATVETREVTAICLKGEPEAPDKPLVLIKWADREAAQVGDVVTFFLKYSNVGGKPMTDVAVSDSLTTRLEYIPGSAQSNRPAVFTTQDNDAGSSILRWEISGRLLPGDSGIIRFQARIR